MSYNSDPGDDRQETVVVEFFCASCHHRAKLVVDEGQIVSVTCTICLTSVDGEDAQTMYTDLLHRAPHWHEGMSLSSVSVVSEGIGSVPLHPNSGRRWPFNIIVE
ncbi:hypothetical protein [Candidatus Poriferisodalis sp.]|uniref:hypothetical protein n=1 Tax=Candidatus Poriferisodalis sp. TaxID=3101277 RepID=UPI003B01B57F